MNTEATHSPGEWTVRTEGNSMSVRNAKVTIARMAISANSQQAPRGYANAYLMAAAPNLLACVKDAHAMLRTVEVIDGESGDPWSSALARMEAAIAKAVQS